MYAIGESVRAKLPEGHAVVFEGRTQPGDLFLAILQRPNYEWRAAYGSNLDRDVRDFGFLVIRRDPGGEG